MGRCNYWLAVPTMLLLAGCTVGPKYVQPKVSYPEAWLDTDDERVRVEPGEAALNNSEWWAAFNDPVLDKLIATAYQQNYSLQLAGLRVLEARAQRGIAIGQFFPQLQEAVGSVTGNHISDNAANAALLDKTYWDESIGFQAAWELDFWGKFRRAIDASDAEMLASIATYDDVLVSLIASVAGTYVEIRAFEERLSLARANVAIQQRSLEITEVRFRRGAVTELDVAQARTNLTNTQALIPLLEQGHRQAANRLCTLLGLPPQDIGVLLDGAGTIPTAPREIVVGIPADLLRRRPDVRSAERLAAAQSERIGIATAEFYPSFTITGYTGFQTSSGYSSPLGGAAGMKNIFDGQSFTGFIDFGFNWPILNYGRIANNVRVQDARFEQAATAYKDTVIRAAAQVEDALIAFLRSQERAGFLAESVTAAQRSVELAQTQYRDGACDFTRVLNSQGFLTAQQDELAVTRAQEALSLIGTYRALGGGWELRGVNEFIPVEMSERMRARTDWNGILSVNEASVGEKVFGRSAPKKAGN
jgi:NodT family efflux transporter outer membrane factor (OMF) lipoprotein